jgi:hypothetical protein
MSAPDVGGAAVASPAWTLPAAAVCEETARRCAERYGRGLRAVVVTGSLARDEATFVEEPGGIRLLGDGEFLLIFADDAALPPESEVRDLGRLTEEGLRAGAGLTAHIGLSAGKAAYLSALEPHIFALELRECGRVVWGEPGILSLVPGFRPADLSLEDAWRLLANRLVEQLALASGAGSPGAGREMGYRTLKLYLDMATSLLVFAGAYAPTYRERADRLIALAARADADAAWPFPLREFAERVDACTRLKLASQRGPVPVAEMDERLGRLDWRQAVGQARRLWRWELARLAKADPVLDDRALMSRWMRAQPLPARLRGWLYVARRAGWWRSCRHWPRWMRYGWRASPRYWVYWSATDLVFRLPDLLGGGPDAAGSLEDLAAVLPVPGGGAEAPNGTGWQRLAGDIAWNYERFLTETRA